MPVLRVVEAEGLHDGPRAAWDALVAQQPLPSPFLRTWWLDAMPRPQRVFLTMHDHNRLVGGIPLVRDRFLGLPRYRFLGQGALCPDHLDLVAAPGAEQHVADAFAAWFRSRCRLLDVSGLVRDSLVARALRVRSDVIDVAPYQGLPASASDYLASRSAGFRKSVRRLERRYAEAGISHHRATTRRDITEALECFRALHERRPGREQLLAEMPVLTSAALAGADRGEVQVDLLTDGDAAVAVTLFFCLDGRLSFYQLARSLDRAHDGAGRLLVHQIVVDGIAAGFREIDLLRGDEPYKASFADEVRELHRVRVGNGAASRTVAWGWRTASRARAMLAERRGTVGEQNH
jgi:CelD/BcsL family acetyltransferase involved in cellulose biosynthesis